MILLGCPSTAMSTWKGGTSPVLGDKTCGVWYLLQDLGRLPWDCTKLELGC